MTPPLAPFQRRSRLLFLAVLGGGVAVLLANGSFRVPLLPRCGIWSLTGLPCPLCGGTRSAKTLLAGDWSRSMEWNPLVPPLVVIAAAWSALLLLELALNRCLLPDTWWSRWRGRIVALSFVFLIVWWGGRLAYIFQTSEHPLVDSSHPVASKLQSLLRPAGKPLQD